MYSTLNSITETAPVFNRAHDKFVPHLFLPENSERKGFGGLRTKEKFKKSLPDIPLVTIITVVFNGEKFLEETILSVLNQTYTNVEYIIVDGGSTDGTLDIIKHYADYITYWVSEPDDGIYDAMNKGISFATGDWINFMNAGDQFYKNTTLLQLFGNIDFPETDIIYGDVQVNYGARNRIRKTRPLKKLNYGMPFCHQSAFIRTSVHKENLLNIGNRISADFEFFYNLYGKKAIFRYIPMVFSTVSNGGVSDVKRVETVFGFWKVVGYESFIANLYFVSRLFIEVLKKFVKNA